MKKLTYLLAVSVLSIASTISVSASEDAGTHASRMDAATAARIVKTSYEPSAAGSPSQVSVASSVNETPKSVAGEKPLANELPQDGVLTLLAGLAIIVVIGKRRRSS
jgi:hypothetical protein